MDFGVNDIKLLPYKFKFELSFFRPEFKFFGELEARVKVDDFCRDVYKFRYQGLFLLVLVLVMVIFSFFF